MKVEPLRSLVMAWPLLLPATRPEGGHCHIPGTSVTWPLGLTVFRQSHLGCVQASWLQGAVKPADDKWSSVTEM